jgi:aryl carrier-like protein
MVPSHFVALDALPLTPHGKVNRAALPPPGRAGAERRVVAPRTPIETALSEIWAEVLGCGPVGVEDDFFDLGGDSLLAMRLLARLRIAFRVDVPLRALFEAPRLAELATLIVCGQARQADPDEIARVLREIHAISDEEARGLLEDVQG